uniref:MAK10-like protein n=1 Tax=Tanacetum cinerariifolium TaxID=118510 RepID=A0A6L2JE99_TANCI|nr:MAK10-like protein [Tanacetum cinerariifolium]
MDSDVMLIDITKDNEYPSDDELNKDDDVGEEEFKGYYFDKFPICSELAYHKKNPKSPSGLNNFTGRANGMHIFGGNFTYVLDFMIIEDISSVTDPRVSYVVLGKPFVELPDMTYDSSLGVVRLTNGNEEITYKMPRKIEQYDSLLNDENRI